MLTQIFTVGNVVTFTEDWPQGLSERFGAGPFEVSGIEAVPYAREVQSCRYCGCIVPNKDRPTANFKEAIDELMADMASCQHVGESSYGGVGHPQYVDLVYVNEYDPRPQPGTVTGAYLRLWTEDDQREWERLNRFPVHVHSIRGR